MVFYLVFSPAHKMLKCILYSLVLVLLMSTSTSFAQQPAQPTSDQAGLTELIRSASLRISEYKAKFKDLTAEEEQKIEEYDDKGRLKRQRRIVSDLIIYQSQLDTSLAAEYRNVRVVDGKEVKKREERVVNLFSRLARADSVKKEVERINRESQRYNLAFSSEGLTLHEGEVLNEDRRPAFQFSIVGREQLNGRAVIVLQYRQVAQIPGLNVKLSLPSVLKGAELLYRGRLWLDAETSQLWREEREWTLRHPSSPTLLVLMRFEFEYVGSRFGILTPQRIAVSTFTNGRTRADKTPELLLSGKVTFEYGSFSRFDVSAPDASIEPPTKP